RDEPPDWNPFAGRIATARVYGPQPGAYGVGLGETIDRYTDDARRAAGEAWLAASAYPLDLPEGQAGPDAQGLRDRIAGTDAFVHL
ncbi:hypothetical protein ACO1MH_14660, partial [Staphylococcus aureus]